MNSVTSVSDLWQGSYTTICGMKFSVENLGRQEGSSKFKGGKIWRYFDKNVCSARHQEHRLMTVH